MNSIAIIPARAGSKGLKDKNILPLAGVPLLGHSVRAALESERFAEVFVSTDSIEYAEIARDYGARVPFLRSAESSTDQSSSWQVVDEALLRYQELHNEFDTFCLLQPTSPLRTADDIRGAYELFERHSAGAVISVCEAEHSPHVYGQMDSDGSLNGFLGRGDIGARQAYGTYYRVNGAIYIARVSFYKDDPFLFRLGSYGYVMPQDRSVDIDSEVDFVIADYLMRIRHSEKTGEIA